MPQRVQTSIWLACTEPWSILHPTPLGWGGVQWVSTYLCSRKYHQRPESSLNGALQHRNLLCGRPGGGGGHRQRAGWLCIRKSPSEIKCSLIKFYQSWPGVGSTLIKLSVPTVCCPHTRYVQLFLDIVSICKLLLSPHPSSILDGLKGGCIMEIQQSQVS